MMPAAPPRRIATKGRRDADRNRRTAKKISTENAEVIEYLLDDAGFTTQDVSEMLSPKPRPCQNRIGGAARETVEFLNATFNLRKCDLRKIFREQPGLLLPSATNNVIRDTGACPAVLATASGGPAAGPRQEIADGFSMTWCICSHPSE